MSAPAVSILLPTYNGVRYLPEQIDSILGQSWRDFELVAVDDGSSDGTAELLRSRAERDPRIRLLEAGGNLGQKERLAQLAREARAPLLSIADQDDVWHPERTRRLVEGLGGASLAYGRSELIDGEGRPLGRTLIENFGPPPAEGDRLALLFVPRVSGHCMLVRREAATEMAFRRFQPFDWLIALDALFSAGLAYVDEAIVFHRLHGGNQSNAAVDARPSPLQRLKPGRIYAEMQSTRRRRFNFLQRLEHLGHSPVLETERRRLFMRLASLCRDSWFQPGSGPPFVDRALRRVLADGLRPLAGSERDWFIAMDHITGLTQAQVHPRALYQSAKLLFWY